jgi:hypothetical protein
VAEVRKSSQAMSVLGAGEFVDTFAINASPPQLKECAMPLRLLDAQAPIQNLVTGFVTELRNDGVTWEEITVGLSQQQTNVVKLELYVWPMHTILQHSGGRVLLRCSISNPCKAD